MKRTLIVLIAAVAGFALGSLVTYQKQPAANVAEMNQPPADWEKEKTDLEAALKQARARQPETGPVVPAAAPAAVANKLDPEAILRELSTLTSANDQTRAMRRVVVLLDQLRQAGSAALPAIARFLKSNEDVAYAASGKGRRDVQSLSAALVPMTLRLGLFDIVRQIGGEKAETILAETLGKTARPIEVAYLTQLLEETLPGKYHEMAINVAKGLLAGTTGAERDYLFDVLKRFGDDSYVSTAQDQLVLADGKIDRSALRYLQRTLGEKSVAIAAQAYADTRITDKDSKEPLARVALAYVGVNEQAAELFHTALMDPALKPDQRRELAEDLNQDGIANEKAPTPADVKIIANRLALTQAYLQTDYVRNDKFLDAGFREANKDLNEMLRRAAAANAGK